MGNSRTITDLQAIIEEIKHLVSHPRIQQKTWVAKGKVWLLTLAHAVEELQQGANQQDNATESLQSVLAVLERGGLKIEKRNTTHWGYRWHNGELKGAYATRAEAIEAALRDRK
ncbi:MAG: hypothetical protein KF726_21630 [Anaerolineae bacterium]|nr:hypothetical protein [Anaerolineae bacterium]